MLTIEELESLIVDALNSAIDKGFLLISGAEGVKWNTANGEWEWDSKQCSTKACDLWGAMLLSHPGTTSLHQGDYFIASRAVIDSDFYVVNPSPDLDTLLESASYQLVQNVMNGWDNEEFVGGYPDAYMLGNRLAGIYRPMSIEVLNISSNGRSVHTPAPAMNLDDYSDDDESEGSLASGVRLNVASEVELSGISELEASVG